MNATITKESKMCLGIFKSPSSRPFYDHVHMYVCKVECFKELTDFNTRYFSQRYSIFSLYDDGVCMTDDAWFGVTPEPVAKYVQPELPIHILQPCLLYIIALTL